MNIYEATMNINTAIVLKTVMSIKINVIVALELQTAPLIGFFITAMIRCRLPFAQVAEDKMQQVESVGLLNCRIFSL